MAEIFLRLEGIPGESRDAKHRDEIEVAAYDWGVDRPATGHAGGGAGAGGRPTFRAFSFRTGVSKASPELFRACVNGKHLPEAVLSVRRAGRGAPDHLRIRFTDVVITSFAQAAGDQEDPLDSVAFEFGKVELQHTPQGAPG